MPAATPQHILDKIVELRSQKPPKSYRQIEAETGANQLVIAKTLKKAGLTGQGSPSAAAPASTPAPAPATAKPAASPTPSSTATSDLSEFQPPAPPAPKKANPICRCEHCGAQFRLDDGEDVATVKCPGCGQ